MYPVLLDLGPLTFYSLWVFVAIGFFAALLVINKLIKKNRLSLKFIADYSLLILFSGLIMGRLIFVLHNFNYYFYDYQISNFLEVLYIWDKGISGWGALLGIALSIFYFAKRKGENPWKWLDITIIGVLAAMFFFNIGAFLDGVNFGRETNLPWGVIIETSIYAVPIHPVQLYSAIFSGGLAYFLYTLSATKTGKIPGNILLIGVLAFSIFKFLQEFLRGDETLLILGLREGQIFALLGIMIPLILLAVKKFKINEKT
jgi:phosphatidylglycerol:prolipoprotein diacylglycerol transferase